MKPKLENSEPKQNKILEYKVTPQDTFSFNTNFLQDAIKLRRMNRQGMQNPNMQKQFTNMPEPISYTYNQPIRQTFAERYLQPGMGGMYGLGRYS